MSNQDVEHEILKYVEDTPLGVLAYVRADGTPVQRTFGAFAVSGNDVLFATSKSAAKVANITARPQVSFFVEKKDQDMNGWKSALYLGTAAPITSEDDLQLAVKAISARNEYIRNLVAQDGLKEIELYRLKTSVIEWLDHAKGQGHVDLVVVQA
jgi:pyridoxamine 5'-phosphate oxidase